MKTLIAAALMLTAAAPALAQSSMMLDMLAKRFASADKDKDGKLTKAEAEKGMPRIFANFDKIDAARRGYVTLDQIKAILAARM